MSAYLDHADSCETMIHALVICTDKTSTLTQNEMAIVAGSIGIHAKFVRKLDENPARAGKEATSRPNAKDFAVDIGRQNSDFTLAAAPPPPPFWSSRPALINVTLAFTISQR